MDWRGDDQVKANMADYGRQVEQTVTQVMLYWAPVIEAAAKRLAPWTDRTGNARQSLFTAVETRPGSYTVLYLSHAMSYGVQLETRFAGRYAVILPTLEMHYQPIMSMLKGALL